MWNFKNNTKCNIHQDSFSTNNPFTSHSRYIALDPMVLVFDRPIKFLLKSLEPETMKTVCWIVNRFSLRGRKYSVFFFFADNLAEWEQLVAKLFLWSREKSTFYFLHSQVGIQNTYKCTNNLPDFMFKSVFSSLPLFSFSFLFNLWNWGKFFNMPEHLSLKNKEYYRGKINSSNGVKGQLFCL